MRVIFNPDLKANLTLDEAERVRSIDHSQQYRVSDQPTPLLAAIDYLNQVADVLQIAPSQLTNLRQSVSFIEPREQGIEYHLSEQKAVFDSTTVGFTQTYLNIPVWRAGLTVTVKHNPYRIIGAVNTSQEGFDASLPAAEVTERYQGLFRAAELDRQRRRLGVEEAGIEPETANFVRSLVDTSQLRSPSESFQDDARLIRGRFYLYKYDAGSRLPQGRGAAVAESPTAEPILPLAPVPETIREGRYYVVSEVTFSYTTQEHGRLNWLALVEVKTGSVLYLRALVGYHLDTPVNGLVFTIDPISASGDATLTADRSNAVLNPSRTSVPLPNLDAPVAGIQSLRGGYAHVTNVRDPNVNPPTKPHAPPALTNFDYDVRTNDFAAVSAYYHVDRLFTVIESLGFPISTYFSHTTFPARVDHRSCSGSNCPNGITINAYFLGNGSGGIDHIGYMLNDLTDTTNPVGRACDSRVTWHEVGGHAALYEHVDDGVFNFCHSAGDSLSLIFHDPDSQAPDRFRYAPWHPTLERRCDRTPAAGWGWGGTHDDKGYGTEEILATTLFRVYRSIGGDSTDLSRRRFASRMMLYLILRAIETLTPATNPNNAQGFLDALTNADTGNWTTEGVYGGAYNKVLRWSFAEQGLSTAVLPVDVYIEDGRGGAYMPYQAVHWQNTSIWNRRHPDGGTTHEEPALSATNYAYVKIKNRGAQTATNVKVKGYHCKPSAGVVWPNDFQAFTTVELSAGTLSGNNTQEKIVGPFEWTPIVNAWGHDCMLMIVSADGDPSNVDNFTPGEFIEDWRLVPNDNNVAQRNVNVVPGGGGTQGLIQGLNKYSFWVGNPKPKTAIMTLQVQLPEFLVANGWRLSFKDIADNQFGLPPGKQREVFIELHPGEDFNKQQVEQTEDRDIQIFAYADDMLIGGMTYRLDPEIKEPYNKRDQLPGLWGKIIKYLPWAWLIIVGGLLITPGGIICIKCGPLDPGYIGDLVINLLAIVSIVLGITGLTTSLLRVRGNSRERR